jgi:hypothetical protein
VKTVLTYFAKSLNLKLKVRKIANYQTIINFSAGEKRNTTFQECIKYKGIGYFIKKWIYELV